MKIIHTCHRYYPAVGGVECVVKSISEELVKLGYEVIVFAGDPNVKRPYKEYLNGVFVIRWPTWAPDNAFHIPRIGKRLKNVLKELFDETHVTHIHNIHSVMAYYVWKIWRANRKNRSKLVITPYYHGGSHLMHRNILWVPWRLWVEKMLRSANVIHTVSKIEAVYVKRDFGLDAVPIENGVTKQILDVSWAPNNFVLYAGRIEEYKNIDRLARIIFILNKHASLKLRFLIIGRGTYERKLKWTLDRMGIEYDFYNFQPFREYIRILSRASFFGLLSEKESFPQSVNEANAIGTPVVIAKPWGVNFTDRRRTLIIDLNDDDERIAKKIHRFLGYVPKEPRAHVSTWSEVVQAYISKLYLAWR